MKCPHCHESFFEQDRVIAEIGKDVDGVWHATSLQCPACRRIVVWLRRWGSMGGYSEQLVRPKGISRAPTPPSVTLALAQDYTEACLVLADSPKASAALSRRCLQHLLREKASVTPGNLASEIQQVLDSKQLPPYLADDLDAVRNTGNFAAHPLKSTTTGEIIDVEPGEAEWNLDVLEALFDFYFVQPAAAQAKRDALNAKLAEAGKPPMKTA